ncbi:MAG TPA: hypothetical protein VFO79_07220 [Xanthomonadales bacterium]|nr:hypothetical protein [Xanthomonadales bacterium]
MARWRDYAMLGLAWICLAFYPLIRLWQLPKTLRFMLVERRLVKRFTRYDDIVRARWFTRNVFTIASGAETDHYFELDLVDGTTVAVYDDFDRSFERTLAALELLPVQSRSLGDSPSELAWMFWFIEAAVLAFVIAVCC